MCPQVNQFTAGGDGLSEFLEGGMSPSQMWVNMLGCGNRTNKFFEDDVRRQTGTSSTTGAPVLTAKPPDSGSSSLVFAVASGCGGVLLLVAVACWLKLRKDRDKAPAHSGVDVGCITANGVLVTMDEANRMHNGSFSNAEAHTTERFHFEMDIGDGLDDNAPAPSLYDITLDANDVTNDTNEGARLPVAYT
jgi:hypothetical protein